MELSSELRRILYFLQKCLSQLLDFTKICWQWCWIKKGLTFYFWDNIYIILNQQCALVLILLSSNNTWTCGYLANLIFISLSKLGCPSSVPQRCWDAKYIPVYTPYVFWYALAYAAKQQNIDFLIYLCQASEPTLPIRPKCYKTTHLLKYLCG